MGGGPLGRGHVLELPVGVLQPLQDGQLFELDALVALQFRLLGPVLHRDQPVYDLPEQYRQGQAGQTRGDRDDEGRGPLPARLLLLLPLPSVRPGLPLVRPDARREYRREDDRPPHRRSEYRVHRVGAVGRRPDPSDGPYGDSHHRPLDVDGPRHEGRRAGAAFARAALRRLAAFQRRRYLQGPDEEHERRLPLPAAGGSREVAEGRRCRMGRDSDEQVFAHRGQVHRGQRHDHHRRRREVPERHEVL